MRTGTYDDKNCGVEGVQCGHEDACSVATQWQVLKCGEEPDSEESSDDEPCGNPWREWSPKNKIRYNHAFKIWNLNRDLDGGTEGNAMALNTDGVGPYGLNVVTTRGDHDELTDPDATCSSWVFLRPECGGGGSVRYGDIVQLGNCYTHESVFDGERSVLMTSGLAENGFAAMTTVLSDPQASQPESQWVVRGGPEGRRVHTEDVIKLENVYCHENYYDGANNYLIMRTGTYDDKNCGVEGVQCGHEDAYTNATQWQVLKYGEEPDSECSDDDEPCGNPW